MEKENTGNIYPYKFKENNYRCAGDNIVIRPLKYLTQTLTTQLDLSAVEEKNKKLIALEYPYRGEVVMVGDGYISGVEGIHQLRVYVGDVIFYKEQHYPLEILFDNDTEKFNIIRDCDILLVKQKTEASATSKPAEDEQK